jgi:hypothetical protein
MSQEMLSLINYFYLCGVQVLLIAENWTKQLIIYIEHKYKHYHLNYPVGSIVIISKIHVWLINYSYDKYKHPTILLWGKYYAYN